MNTTEPLASPKAVLESELARRCEKNPSYSLRAFARALGISHTVLSLVLSGKRKLSKKASQKVVQVLDLDPVQKQAFLVRGAKFSEATVEIPSYQQITLDSFAVISDWYHYAILSLLDIPGTKLEAKWIASKLSISETQAKLGIERLKRLGLIALNKGRWKQTGLPIKVENETSTAATRKFHKQLLNRALDSLENEPMENRDFSSMTLAMDPSLIPYAKKRIQAFRRSLCQELEGKGSPKRVYELTVQIFPVTKILENKS